MRHALATVLVALVVVAATTSIANASTKIGDAGVQGDASSECDTYAGAGHAGIFANRFTADVSFEIPSDGIITSFSGFTSSGATEEGRAQLLILAPIVAGNGQTILTASPLATFPAASGKYTIAARIPVTAGQSIGLLGSGSTQCLVPTLHGSPTAETLAVTDSSLAPEQAIAGTPITTSVVRTQRPTIEAQLETDADGDGYGDDTQDACVSLAAIHAGSGCAGDIEVSGITTAVSVPLGTANVVRVTLRNISALQDSLDSRVTVTIPTGVDLVAPVSGCAGVPLVCSAGRLAPGAFATFDIPVRGNVVGDTSVGLVASQSNPDSNAANNATSSSVRTTTAPVVAAPADTAAPSIHVLRPAPAKFVTFAKAGLATTFVVSEASVGTIQLRQGSTVIASANLHPSKPSSLTIRLRATKAGAKVLRRAKGKRLKLTLRVTLADAAGNVGTATVPVVLTR